MVKKIIALGVALVVGLGLFSGCKNDSVFTSEDFSLILEVNGAQVNAGDVIEANVGDIIEVKASLVNLSGRNAKFYFLIPEWWSDWKDYIGDYVIDDLGVYPRGVGVPSTAPPRTKFVKTRLKKGENLTRTINHQFVEILQDSEGNPFSGIYSAGGSAKLYANGKKAEPFTLSVTPITIKAI